MIWSFDTGDTGGYSMAFSPDSRMLAADYRKAAHDGDEPTDIGFVCVWDLETGKLIQTLDGHGVCPEVKFSADGRQLAVEDRGEIFIYSTTNWELSQVLEGKDRRIGDWT